MKQEHIFANNGQTSVLEGSLFRPTTDFKMRRYFTVTLEKGLDGFLVVTCVELPGVVTQGRTEEEAQKKAIEAISLMLEELGQDENTEFTIVTKRKP